MGDTLNSLLSANRSSTVLQGIVNPAQVNPLAAINSANQAAQGVFNTRKLQAEQALGGILQQATDPAGNVDYQKAQSLAAAAGPVVQMGMQSYLTNNAQLRGAQISQAAGLHTLVGNMATSLMNDPSDENLAKIRASAVASGLPPGALTEIDRIGALPKEQRGAEAYKHAQANLDALGRLATSGYGAPTLQDTGTGGVRPVLTTPRSPYGPGGTTVLPGGVTTGPQPGATTTSVEPFDDQGQIPRDAHGVPTRTPKTWQQTTVPTTAVPGVPQGGQQIGPGGQGTAPAPGPGRGSAPSTTPPPPPAGTTARPSARPPTAGTDGGGTQPPATQPPASQPPQQQADAGAKPPVLTQPPQGQPAEIDESVKHASDARARTLTYQRDIQPVEGALSALSGADTGRASETLNSLRANIQDITPSFLQRMLPSSLTDPAARKAYEEANKYLTQMQLQAPGGSRSDTGAATAGAATPSVHISNAAAREVTLAILAQRRMEQAGTLLFNQSGKAGGEFDRHMGEWNTQADPRAFVVDKMTPEERAAYVKSLGGTGTAAYAKYKNSYKDAVTSGVVAPPAPGRGAMLTPPPVPQVNPLTLAG